MGFGHCRPRAVHHALPTPEALSRDRLRGHVRGRLHHSDRDRPASSRPPGMTSSTAGRRSWLTKRVSGGLVRR